MGLIKGRINGENSGLASVLSRFAGPANTFVEKAPAAFLGVVVVFLVVVACFAAPADTGASGKIAAVKAEKTGVNREKLYRELAAVPGDETIAFLSQAAISEAEPGGRISSIMALRKLGGQNALKGILAALAVEKHKGVRLYAVNSLGFFNYPGALAKLRETAGSDPDKDLRLAAYLALARLNDTDTISNGFDVEKDTNVKLGIVDALNRTGGGEKKLGKIKVESGDKKIKARADGYTKRK